MLRILKIAFLSIIIAFLVTTSFANREIVTMVLFPPEIAELLNFNWSITAPQFMIVLGSVVVGLILGFIWEWIRESGYRREMDKRQRQVKQMRRELDKAKKSGNMAPEDDVLALLDKSSKSA